MTLFEYKSGNMLYEKVDALVNTVNCVGVMGRGIALQFKKIYPDNFKAYAIACKNNEVQPGRLFVFKTQSSESPQYIINFPTKRHWRAKSIMSDIDLGLNALVDVIKQYEIKSIAIPPLGSGLGGLDWKQVKNRIERTLHSISDLQVIIYEPSKQSAEAKKIVTNVPKMTPGRAVLLMLMNRYLKGLLDPFVTLLEIHKLMYFMQESGQELNLNFQKAHYGPYAENLRHVLNMIEGTMITGYLDGGDAPTKEIQILPDALKSAEEFLQSHTATHERLERVADLVDGFETPFGLELLATVHWIMKYNSITDLTEVIKQVHAWNERKREFYPRQIEIAFNILNEKGWTGS